MPVYTESYLTALEERACQLRLTSLEMIARRKAGHPGGTLSCAEVMAALFFHKLRINPQQPEDPLRDRFILSKGHASAILYAALAARGFFPAADLAHWGELDCHPQGHPDRLKTPGVEMTSGVLGHGIAIGVGLALAARMDQRDYRVYTLLGDGECQGGIVWEGAMVANKFRLANLVAILDSNNVQLDGPVHEVMPMEPLADKWRAFGWYTVEIDGHNLRQVLEALDLAEQIHDRPTMIIAHTTKGRGVSFMENDCRWHGVAPDEAQLAQACQELKEAQHG
jgi:transketolase